MSSFDQRSKEELATTPVAQTADAMKPRAPDESNRSSSATSPQEPVASPAPSIPKGGGALRGIGEKFSANPVTGTASLQIPIATSPGRAGFHPDLSLSYDSGAGNGLFGHGWSLSVPHVTRKTDKGLPTYFDLQDQDLFILSGGEDLVPKRGLGQGSPKERFIENGEVVERFAPRVEGAFVRIERRSVQATGDVYWRATTHDNVTSVYGRTAGARIANPKHPNLVFTWLLEETRDDKGNVVTYEYKPEDLDGVGKATWEAHRLQGRAPIVNLHLKRVRYGNTVPGDPSSCVFEVVFDYGEHDPDVPTRAEARPWPSRNDPFSSYRSHFEIRAYRLCRRVLMFHHMPELGSTPCLVRSTDFVYAEDEVMTQLVSATHTGYIRNDDGITYTKKSYPPVTFGYSQPTLHTKVQVVDRQSVADLPTGVIGAYQWTDLDGEGLPGVLSQQGTALTYKKNLGAGKLAPARVLMSKPSMARLGASGQQVADIDGDGEKELVFFEPPVAGYHDRRFDGTWGPFQPFDSQPMINWADPCLRFIDLTGDGFDDLLVDFYDHRFLWFKSMGKRGYASPEIYPKRSTDEDFAPGYQVVFADHVQTIFLADMTGDGLTDLVRIVNGSVCYWPNIGRGHFGAKVQMGGITRFDEPDQFDPRRIRLADVDGSGTIDILYIHRDGIRLYRNQSGNSFAAPVTLPRFPDHSDLSAITTVDLLGTGTACVVWSSSLPGEAHAPMRYIDLMGGQKPYLLTSIDNGLGLKTTLEYTPSTKFYRDDAAAGKPWATRLPFPVHTLSRVETFDAISRHRFVTSYTYHHGFFDGVEREFRGFGMVEQLDTESFSAFSGTGILPPPANASDPELHVPPVLTKTWFHTGAWNAGARLARQFAQEYFKGDPKAILLPETVLPTGLLADEEREACRALKGQILRQEVYSLDGSAVETRPYLVSERSYEVLQLQSLIRARSGGLGAEARIIHGVFFAHPREAIEYHYDRTLDDPRITHAFTLDVDDLGVVRRSAMVGYPRRSAHVAFAEQAKGAITLSEVDVRHHAPTTTSDWYRVGVPLETRTYELTGLALSGDVVLPFDAVDTASQNAAAIPYEQAPDGSLQKRLVSQGRSMYYANDLSGPLPFGQVESLALPYQSYTKAFTPALLARALGTRVTDTILAEGRYVQLLPDDAWWMPSGRQVFSPAEFYMPVSLVNPFNNATSVVYDTAYHLFVAQVSDPVGNVVSASYDLRVLAPSLVTDPNGNQTAASFDELGRVVATAVMGKPNGSEGDTLAAPTTSFDYDLDRFRLAGKPSVVHVRAREQHGAANTRFEESYSYSDGSGHEVMRKIQAEPGKAPERDATGALVLDAQGKLVLADVSPRWVGTGRTVLDNKGNPVKQYEPFFSSTFEYEDESELVQQGVTPILHHDPVGRLIRTDLPNGTFSKVDFDPWKETHFDPNDTVLESAWYASRKALDPTTDPEGRAAQLAAAHAGTPAVMHLDALGRAFQTIEDNGTLGQYATHVTLDVEANPLVITDARGVLPQVNVFGMGGLKLFTKSCDAGDRHMLPDVAGTLLRAWEGAGATEIVQRVIYDEARRVTHHFVQQGAGQEILVERTVYGEKVSNAATANLRSKAYQQYDGAGVVTNVGFDFKGNLLASQRRLARKYDVQADWSVLLGITDPALLANAAEPMLDAEVFGTQTAYDALNRPTSLFTPDRSEVRPTYNEASLLERVDVRIKDAPTWTAFVDDIDYNAKGQRESIVYATPPPSLPNAAGAVTTAYTYDPLTFRMARLTTTRAQDGALLQDLAYTYDPVGNITQINDGAQQSVFYANDVVLPQMAYVYDALYRLIQASGREQAGGNADVQRDQNDIPVLNLPHQNDAQAVRNYQESYVYDEVGNLVQMKHDASSPMNVGSWSRQYAYETDATGKPVSNRLVGTSVPGDAQGQTSAKYTYDGRGNMASMPHLASLGWSFKDEMASADLGGGGVVYFTYDTTGQRARKVWVHSGLVDERIYVGGWEVFRRRSASTGDVMLERETLHVMDGVKRIALVETKTVDTSAGGAFQPSTVMRFQMGNHLGSAVLEVDETGAVISYEEYHPYGTTAYQSATSAREVSAKRYRYTGKERDEETGLYYHGARYYAPWLGRWTSADPAGINDGTTLFTYAANNPTAFNDPTGMEPNLATLEKINNAWMAFDPEEGTYIPVDVHDSVKDAPQLGPVKQSGEYATIERGGKKESVPLAVAQIALANPESIPEDTNITLYVYAPPEQAKDEPVNADALKIQVELERQHVLPSRLTSAQGAVIAGPVERDPNGGYRLQLPPQLAFARGGGAWTDPSVLPYPGTRSVRAQAVIDAVVEDDLKNVRFTFPPIFSPNVARGVAGRNAGTQIGAKSFESRAELVDTLIHEELHHRWYERGIPGPHHLDRELLEQGRGLEPSLVSRDLRFSATVQRYTRLRGYSPESSAIHEQWSRYVRSGKLP